MLVFFFNDTATTEIYTLSLHDALPIWAAFLEQAGFAAVHWSSVGSANASDKEIMDWAREHAHIVFTHDMDLDRKSTRLNSSHANISYAVFCLKKKNRH